MMSSGLPRPFSPRSRKATSPAVEGCAKMNSERIWRGDVVIRHLHCRAPAGWKVTLDNSTAPTPGRRKSAVAHRPRPGRRRSPLFKVGFVAQVLLLLLLFLSSGAQAGRYPAQREPAGRALLVDPRPSPRPARRQDEQPAAASSTTLSFTSTLPAFSIVPSSPANSSTSTSTNSTSTEATPPVPSTESTTLPEVFDSNIGSNFTSAACQNFFTKLQTDADFQRCYPLSLLLTNSLGFFQSEKNFFTITYVLDAACRVDYGQCNGKMSSLAGQLSSPDVCNGDLQDQNPLVQQTYAGLLSYSVLFQAGCLKDTGGNYCFADAVTNATSVADTYPYFLPLGTPLAGADRPTCDSCLKNTMDIFAGAAANSSQPVSKTYISAAEQIDISCGPNWVPQSIKSSGAAASRVVEGISALSCLVVLVFAIVL